MLSVLAILLSNMICFEGGTELVASSVAALYFTYPALKAENFRLRAWIRCRAVEPSTRASSTYVVDISPHDAERHDAEDLRLRNYASQTSIKST